MRIGIVIIRAANMDATWTTIDLACAALRRGHQVRFIERTDFEIDRSAHLVARAHLFEPPDPGPDAMIASLCDRTAPRRSIDLQKLDLLLLRVAPLDPAVIHFATLARDRGVPVTNDPEGIVRVSNKAWLAAQPGIPTPPTLVTRSAGTAGIFHSQSQFGVIVKPARGSGGRAVTLVPRHAQAELVRAFEAAKATGDGYVVLQAYLPDAEKGEKRLVWLDGEIIGGYLRRRAPGEFRHNLKRGGTAAPALITDEERNLALQLSPLLVEAGIRIAGLDVIGGRITEVNALNPGGTFHSDRVSGSRLAERIVERLESTVGVRDLAEIDTWAHPAP
ncbi:MAG: hypothetical protein JRI25_05175 [Deltaproteobacteria bacterium]|nr:hypothetical protein [Deltaproteobacteria bacterium]MBW2253973.1 hypothetical protein [Deltaproteobacteria bacterium]